MCKLEHEFRESLISYIKNPDDDRVRRTLITCAVEIFKEAEKQGHTGADQYISYMNDSIIEPALKGIKVNSDTAEKLDRLILDLSPEDPHGDIRAL